ncbi:thioredoxin domain-containing protein [Tenacibaculum agarivorans]|uniref:hypothetical protein n=1 Tax=Tenacibaculum agarivorans TaxID=1908389 RepID=UPI001356725A|nr:hypothetical protein [Tenacibaculum agarivorans]
MYNNHQKSIRDKVIIENTKKILNTFQGMREIVREIAETPNSFVDGNQITNFKIGGQKSILDLPALQLPQNKLIVFSSSDCDYCVDYYDTLNKFHISNPEIKIVILEKGYGNDKTINSNFKKYNISEDVLIENNINTTPTTLFLDSNNYILGSIASNKTEDLLSLTQINQAMDYQ